MTNKPQKKAKKDIYDYHEIIDYIQDKYKIRVRDYAGYTGHYQKWATKKGYKGKDPAGKDMGSSQIWYAEYKKDPEGYANRPPYLDFWHWVLKMVEVRRGEDITLEVKEWLDDDEIKKPEFVCIILRYLQTEFGDKIECNVDW